MVAFFVYKEVFLKKELIQKTFGCTRFVYNYFLQECKNNEYQKAYNMCNKLKDLSKEYECLKEVDSYYPSSKSCSRCNHKTEKTNNLNIRKWICESCGTELDRDINASINIMYEGLRMHYQN